MIGYVQNLEMDANNLTKSGTITPAVDFEHLRSVLVITDEKRQVDPDEEDPAEDEAAEDEVTSEDTDETEEATEAGDET